MKLVIDTNVLITTINRKNFEFFIYEEFADKTFERLVSTEILLEYAEKISNFYSPNTADYILKALCSANNTIFAEPFYKWNLVTEDYDDNKFSDLALSHNADFLITFDKDFDTFKTLNFPSLKVVSP